MKRDAMFDALYGRRGLWGRRGAYPRRAGPDSPADCTLQADFAADYSTGLGSIAKSRFYAVTRYPQRIMRRVRGGRANSIPERSSDVPSTCVRVWELSGTEDALIKIVMDCGFGSTARFYQAFKERVGTTPRQFRQMTRS